MEEGGGGGRGGGDELGSITGGLMETRVVEDTMGAPRESNEFDVNPTLTLFV